MRRRLLISYMSLLALSLLTLMVPLSVNLAVRETHESFIAQQGDTQRFASQADPALGPAKNLRLRAELVRYHELFGIGAAVIDGEGKIVAVAPPTLSLRAASRPIERALSADQSQPETIWPWQSADLIVAVPVIQEGEVVGAALTIAPTGPLRMRIARNWAVLFAGYLLAMVLTWLAARWLARWTLRPVLELDAVTHDITSGRLDARAATREGPPELRRLARSFNHMADTVTDLLERQRAFVSDASHQLRTPLGVLRLRVENLADHLDESGRREHALTVEETDRLARILEGLLALATAERHDDPGRVEVDAEDVVDGRVAAWQGQGAALRRTGGLDAPVLALPDAMDQILDALIDNALKFGAGTVTVHLEQVEELGVIHVMDDGPGLPEEELARATERFWRSPRHQNVDGTGLGLSIVAVLVAASGGTIDLLGREPTGLDVRIGFPCSTGSPPGAAARDGWRRRT
ncbi:sensor histidine kinase [Nonomuraea sp. NPDC059194]|uniref:sensor histidine kinase n=1 Tax=Nonomuraea sp. NPDC059194 TaxID=3346764 RepID=UPI0036A9B9A4